MPRDLFVDVSDPSVRVGSRKGYTVPLSLAVHTVVLALVVVIPLVATGALPDPRSVLTYVPVAPGPIPVPPPVRRVSPTIQPRPNPNAAPIEAPSTIRAEPEVTAGFEDSVGDAPEIAGASVIEGPGAVVAPPPPPEPRREPVRVGGNIRAPERVHYAAPAYPPIAQAARIEGVVIIEATISPEGRVLNVRLLRSVPLLDEAAMTAVRNWTYTPTLLNGVPVPVIMTVTVNFQLQK